MATPRTASIWIAALLAGAAACHAAGTDPPPTCGVVAARFLDLARRDLEAAKVDEASSRAVKAQLPAMRDALARACNEGKWSEATRRCLVRANDHIGLEACEQELTDEQRRDLDRGLSGGKPQAFP
ncbi:MAG TPA: hypothetical protein VFP84_17495 [Kofleriaceae bacterium]|nr:hypothetical protein [Kofleriaceae bacterium]